MPTDDEPRKPITIWLNPQELAALDTIADNEQRTRSSMGRILINEAITARQKDNPQ